MQRKKMTLRFDLDRLEGRRAWEYLQRLNPVSMNRTVLEIINQAERADPAHEMIRAMLREELAAALKQIQEKIEKRKGEIDMPNYDDLFSFQPGP